MDKTVRLLIVHRNRLFRECLVSVLSEATGHEVLALADADLGNYQRLNELQPEVVLVDLDLPDNQAVEITRHLATQLSACRVIALVSSPSQDSMVDCIAAGAHACVLTETSIDELETAIEHVLRGETFCSQEIVQSVFVQFARLARESNWRERVRSFELTPRELEILELISAHCSNKQIAKKLGVSVFTVKNHVHNILEKLQLETRFEAVDYARSHHWLKDVAR